MVDDQYAEYDEFKGLPLVALSDVLERFPKEKYLAHVAISYSKLNETRKSKYLLFKSMGYELASYVSPKCTMVGKVTIGENCFILEDQTLQNGVIIGDNVVLWSGNHIGHQSSIGDHTYIASHVVVSGHCRVGEKCFFGVNSATKDHITTGDSCFIGMGACVTKNLKNGSVVLPPASRVIDAHERAAKVIKKKFFGI